MTYYLVSQFGTMFLFIGSAGMNPDPTYLYIHQCCITHTLNLLSECSWDEMALEDLPATIDKVLEVTGASQLFYVAYSQGATAAYAGLSVLSGLQDKIKLLVSLAPAVYMTDTQSPIRVLAPYAKDIAVNLITIYGLA